ncbi:NBS-LRR class disease resistance protein [Striga asiatica]|uniref:NBS-LRR class disease resistance protein n=1 Tax=Striga asiatica TaxID=4170 RepID=A0A5A7QM40_STRAF|nr:NBS-LRR class disease resistance protein [Striga asiatica]
MCVFLGSSSSTVGGRLSRLIGKALVVASSCYAAKFGLGKNDTRLIGKAMFVASSSHAAKNDRDIVLKLVAAGPKMAKIESERILAIERFFNFTKIFQFHEPLSSTVVAIGGTSSAVELKEWRLFGWSEGCLLVGRAEIGQNEFERSMAAYADLLSLTNTINKIQNHPRPPISLDKTKIEPLIKKVGFLQEFLENYTIEDDADDLEGRMVDVANKAEDIIESHIAYHIWDEYEDPLYQYMQKMMLEPEEAEESQIAHHIQEVRGEANEDNKDSCLYGELQKVIHDLDSITNVVAAIKGKARKNIAPKDDATKYDVMNDNILDKLTNNPYSEGSGGSNDVMDNVRDKLTNQQSGRWIIAIAGMGGIGKTTLAKNIYEHRVIVGHFDMRGWTTISQEYNSKRVLLEVLHCVGCTGSEDNGYEELGQKLYQSLFGKRYLIVMDDIWGTDAWEEVKRFFPNDKDNRGSKVLITTRSSEVALKLDGQGYFKMPFLDREESWNLLRRCVFGEEQGCPPPPLELEEIGKEIAKNC